METKEIKKCWRCGSEKQEEEKTKVRIKIKCVDCKAMLGEK